jgi:predicted NBD/HSP70 family sugar kinase
MKQMVLDIGGTAIKAGICENGQLLELREIPTEAAGGGMHVIDRVIGLICDYQKTNTFSRIGISTTGQVNPVTGTILYANQNIPGYTGTPVKQLLEDRFQLPVCVENDVNAAALGESRFGAGRMQKDFVCLTYGTGVGGAVFADGRLYHGSSFSAGEFGAIVVHPEARDPQKDFYSGCYEKYASVTALVERARQLDETLCNGRILFSRREEPNIAALIDDWIREVVYGLVSIVHMLNPSCIILGGGVMEQAFIQKKISQRLMEQIMPSFRQISLRSAALGNRAGLLGASILHEVPLSDGLDCAL